MWLSFRSHLLHCTSHVYVRATAVYEEHCGGSIQQSDRREQASRRSVCVLSVYTGYEGSLIITAGGE